MRARVVVKISPSRLEAVLYRGSRAAARRSRRLDNSAALSRDWPNALSSLLVPLSGMVAELKAEGEHATLIYAASPTLVTNVSSCHVATGESAAVDAAELGLANLCPFPLDDNVSGTQLLYTDPSPGRHARDTHAADGPPSAAPAMLHLASSADTLATSAALAALARGAGLVPDEIVPAEALVIRAAVELATTRATRQHGTAAVLWMSEHGCALAAASRDVRQPDAPPRLAFVRAIALGVETFVDALTKPLQARPLDAPKNAVDPDETVTLDRDEARHVLATVGIPAADTPIPGYPLLSGASLLPALHPVLQRLSVEVKQSVRFGLPDAERGRLRLTIAGGGERIAHLAPIIARQSGIDTHSRTPEHAPPAPAPEPAEPDPDTGDGFIDAVLPYLGKCVNLAPPDVARSATIVRVKQAMWLGVAAALAIVGFDAYSVRIDLSHQRERLASLQTVIEQSRDDVELSERAAAAALESAKLRARIRAAVPETPDWAALLAAISTITPSDARLTDITASLDITGGDRPAALGRCRLAGYMPTDAPAGGSVSRRIDDYLAALNASPIVAGTQLGPTRLVQSQLGPARSFEIILLPITLPPASLAGVGDAHAGPAEVTR